MTSTSSTLSPGAVAVYCGSSTGNQKAFRNAASSVGHALAAAKRPLVYGGGSKGIMGVVSGAVLEGGGKVTGIVPYAMVAAGGEGEKFTNKIHVQLSEEGREKVETIVVDSMHERKVQMARRVEGFIGLPGGLGTFEEASTPSREFETARLPSCSFPFTQVLEVATWTQIGIHKKPVILVNVLSFWEPLRQLIQSSISHGFIQPISENIIVFVNGPSDPALHDDFDWGSGALKALEAWNSDASPALPFDWTRRKDGKEDDSLALT